MTVRRASLIVERALFLAAVALARKAFALNFDQTVAVGLLAWLCWTPQSEFTLKDYIE